MSVAMRLALFGLVRNPLRTAVRTLVLAVAVSLLASMLLFVGQSLQTMTRSAVGSVPLDWQGPVASYASAVQTAGAVGRQSGVAQASPAATAPFSGAAHTGPTGVTDAGSGSLLAVPPDYLRHIRTYRMLQGRLAAGQVVLDQQMAATLQAHIGDVVSFTARPGAAPRPFRVSGVALITAPDVVFQPLNPLLGPSPAQPPANAAIMPLSTFAGTLAHDLPSVPSGAAVVPGAQPGTQWQVQAQLSSAQFAGSPAQAYTQAGAIAHRIERTVSGQFNVVDNLSDSLNTSAGDALYAQTLYIMLAVPGALVGLVLAYLAVLGTVERDRRDLALLRTRGASNSTVRATALVESAALGVIAGTLGTAIAAVAVGMTGGAASVALTSGRLAVAAGVSIVVACGGALVARIAATSAALRGTVADARNVTPRTQTPLWQRLYLDLFALALSALVYWLTASTGFAAVLNPDSNPTLSLSVYMFFAPALLWIGAALLLIRLRGGVLGRLARRATGGRARTQIGYLIESAGRRGAAINRGLLVVSLLLAFGVELAIFTATYDQQAAVDAHLTLGADVTVSAPPGVTAQQGLARRIAAIPGVTATTALDHSYAYIGPDLQDTYGIDTSTIGAATNLRDSYFLGASAAETIARLSRHADGILVSKETISDYQLRIGDRLNLRVLDRKTGRFRTVQFHVEGVVQEFPSAPRDSFMVANLRYLRSADHAGGPNVVFVKTATPTTTAGRIAAATARSGTLVANIDQQAQQTVSSITTVDLRGISQIEEAFTIALLAAAMALYVALAVSERRQEFATMAAVGASTRTIARFIWTETLLVAGLGLSLGAGLGVLLASMLVAILQHVFDPPPDALAIPWPYLGALVAATAGVSLVAVAISSRQLRRMPLGQLLREQ